MGRSNTFKCSSCGLTAVVSGGPDRGMSFFTETVWCGECRLLQDVTVKKTKVRFQQNVAPKNMIDVRPKCSKCKSENVTIWHKDQACPVCSGKVSVDPNGECDLWD